MVSITPRDSEKNMDFWYSSTSWKNILGGDEVETICVPPCLSVLKSWKRTDTDEAPGMKGLIVGQKGEADFLKKFIELKVGGILICDLKSKDLVTSKAIGKKSAVESEWDAIFFHRNRGIFVIEVKAIETNDIDTVNKRIEKAKTQLDRNIENIKKSYCHLYQRECTCITGFICFPFRNDERKMFQGYKVIDKSVINNYTILKKFFALQENAPNIEVPFFQQFAAEFVCCRSKVEFHSQAYNAMQVATWIMEQDIQQKQDPTRIQNMAGNGPSGKIILTEKQLEIVECREKCVIISGAPGAGKTLILMLRALKAAMENKKGSVFVFVNEKLKDKYEHYFYEERNKVIVDRANNIDRRPKVHVHTLDMIRHAKPEDDVFFDETPVEELYIEMIESRTVCGGDTTVVFTGLYNPAEAAASLRLYDSELKEYEKFELVKVLRGTARIFDIWKYYYPRDITLGHSIDGVPVKQFECESLEKAEEEIANDIRILTNAAEASSNLPILSNRHIAIITSDEKDAAEIRVYLNDRGVICGSVDEQSRKLGEKSIVAVDVYLSTPSYEWPVVYVILKPNMNEKEIMQISTSRCIARLAIIKYKNHHSAIVASEEMNRTNNELSEESGIQQSLRDLYLEKFRYVATNTIFTFNIENNWIPLAFKLDDETTSTEDHIDLLNRVFSKKKMLIIEADPGTGKTSLLRRIAYEWAQNNPRLAHYDLVLYAEFRKIFEEQFANISDLIIHYMSENLTDNDQKKLAEILADEKFGKQKNILVLLDGYDESSLKNQCQQLSDYFSSSIRSKPLYIKVVVTSRKGYLSEHRKQGGHFTFADLLGFTTLTQKRKYVTKHFTAENGTESKETISYVCNLLETNENLRKLSDTPLLLTFICLVHHKIKAGSELELYLSIIWWLIDRHQKDFPDRDVPSLFGFNYDMSEEKSDVIERSYQKFPQLHILGRMAMEDIFKCTFTERDLENFQINPIIQQVGLLRKEKMRDDSYRMKTEYSFPHRTIQEFLIAFAFFNFVEDPSENFRFYFLYPWKNIGRGMIQEKLQTFMNMINDSNLSIESSRKTIYSEIIDHSKYVDKTFNPRANRTSTEENQELSIDIMQHSPKSSEEAIVILKKEAEEGNAEACYSLGMIYNYGILTTKNYEEAVKWWGKAARKGYAIAQYNLGFKYENGEGVDQSYKEAVKWFTKAAEQGLASAQFNLGCKYEKGEGVDQSYEEAVKWYTKAAERGHPRAQFNLGLKYEKGQGVDQSLEEAIKWYTKAAEQGHPRAQYRLGVKYETGEGVEQSYNEAIKWYLIAAEQGHPRAQYSLGVKYEKGEGIDQSYEEAARWFKKAAGQDHPRAQYSLGVNYEKGQGVEQSYEEAVKWYAIAAKQGLAQAQYNLALSYQMGQGVEQSIEEAAKWFKKAAEQGNTEAQHILQDNEMLRVTVKSPVESEEFNTKTAEQKDETEHFNVALLKTDEKLQRNTEVSYPNDGAQSIDIAHEPLNKKAKP